MKEKLALITDNLYKFKDCTPLQTINRIRYILEDIGISTEEYWMNEISSIYSVYIVISGTCFYCNGKGITPEFALASGYGELMERLQNFLMATRLRVDASPEVLMYRGYTTAPDEKHISVGELLDNNESWVKSMTHEAATREEKHNILRGWLLEDAMGKPDDFIAVPYIKVNDGSVHYIPQRMLIARCNTNGMCAGNTDEEAMVQGISEIMERYVNGKILRERITPPTVSDSYIRQFHRIYETIKSIEHSGNFKIIVKDCSLGQGFPVMAVILINLDLNTYFVKFGAHLSFEIALERCLTELLQGKSLKKLSWMSRFSYCNKEAYSNYNSDNISITGCGYYPVEFFNNKYSYTFTMFKDVSGCSNRELLSFLLNFLKKRNCDIFVRDVSFLGFPSFHIYIPYMSEAGMSNITKISYISMMRRVRNIVMNLKDAKNEELNEVIEYMICSNYSRYDSITLPTGLPLKPEFPWNSIKRDLFMCAAYYKMGELRKAYDSIDKFIRETNEKEGSENISYYSCVRDYILAKVNNIDNNEIKAFLLYFYTGEVVEKVICDMQKPENVFWKCEKLDCFNCNKCEYSKYCMYDSIKSIHMKLKDRYSAHTVDQKRNRYLTDIFNIS